MRTTDHRLLGVVYNVQNLSIVFGAYIYLLVRAEYQTFWQLAEMLSAKYKKL